MYQYDILDTVAVIEVNSKEKSFDVVYKRERRCKHHNVQFTLTTTGIEPLCCECGMVMKPMLEVIEIEEG